VKVRYTRKALAQLDEIYSHIEAHNPSAAKRVKARIKQSIARLGRSPYSCRATEHPGIRLLAIVRYPYLVFYRVEEKAKEVHILRIRHGARDPSRHLD
jgi:addiction module RelE/StbE family toxin